LWIDPIALDGWGPPVFSNCQLWRVNNPIGGRAFAAKGTGAEGSPGLPPDSTVQDPLLRFRGLTKTFDGVTALDGVDLDLRHGEVHALLGQNGSGKSTLIKVLAGVHGADEPTRAWYDGCPMDVSHPSRTNRPNLHVVHQDPGLVLELSTVDNLALVSGFLTKAGGRVDWKALRLRAREVLERFDLYLDVDKPLAEASPIERAVVAIAFAVSGFGDGASLLVLDEPTAVLPHHEAERLLHVVRRLRDEGITVLYVSHRLDEVFAIADRLTVLRDGCLVATKNVTELTTRTLAELMTGSKVSESVRYTGPPLETPVVLSLEGLRTTRLHDFGLELRRGEIVGLAGLPGSGVQDVFDVLTGRMRPRGGRVRHGDQNAPWKTGPAIARRVLPIVPSDRLRLGVLDGFDVRENMTIADIDKFGRTRLDRAGEHAAYWDWTEKLEIKAPAPDAAVSTLSGGNQQKVVIGRCLMAGPDVLLMAEPTAGVDVGTRQAIFDLLRGLCEQGLTILVTSTDSTDLVALCNRVVVVTSGYVGRVLAGDAIDETNLLASMEENFDDN